MPDQRPTRVRWQVLAILTLVMVVTALGRLNLGIAAKFMQDEFNFSTGTMGWILGAFAFGYALFQIPCGWAGDRYGPRATLTVALAWWGGCTMLMSVLPSLWRSPLALGWSFALLRLFTGAGEAASYPNANKIVAWWTSTRERGLGSSLLLGGVGFGGIVAPLIFAATNQRLGWLSDKAVVRLGRRRGRQSTAFAGMTISALLLLAGSHAVGTASAVLLLSAAAGFSSFAAPSWWASCIDMTPNYSGSLSGLMNTCANIAGGIAPVLTAAIATRFGWTQALDFAATVSFAAGIIWLFVNADSKLESEDPTSRAHGTLLPVGARQ